MLVTKDWFKITRSCETRSLGALVGKLVSVHFARSLAAYSTDGRSLRERVHISMEQTWKRGPFLPRAIPNSSYFDAAFDSLLRTVTSLVIKLSARCCQLYCLISLRSLVRSWLRKSASPRFCQIFFRFTAIMIIDNGGSCNVEDNEERFDLVWFSSKRLIVIDGQTLISDQRSFGTKLGLRFYWSMINEWKLSKNEGGDRGIWYICD